MNYLELINKCLVELNYKQVYAFNELVKNDHKKIKNIINVINSEVCNSEKWDFLLRFATLRIPAYTTKIYNDKIDGRISSLIIDDEEYDYTPDYKKFFSKSKPSKIYSFMGEELLFPSFNETKYANVYYYTRKSAVSEYFVDKYAMENETDTSLIPELFAEPLLVYGTCMRLKANPQHPKFAYWTSMYNNALANLRSKSCIDVNETPSVKMSRR